MTEAGMCGWLWQGFTLKAGALVFEMETESRRGVS